MHPCQPFDSIHPVPKSIFLLFFFLRSHCCVYKSTPLINTSILHRSMIYPIFADTFSTSPWNNPASTRIAQTTTTVFMPILLIKATSISYGNGLTDLRIPTTDVNKHKNTKLPRVRKREMSKSGDLKGLQKYVWYRICLTLLISSSSHHPRRQQQRLGEMYVLMLVPPERGEAAPLWWQTRKL